MLYATILPILVNMRCNFNTMQLKYTLSQFVDIYFFTESEEGFDHKVNIEFKLKCAKDT